MKIFNLTYNELIKQFKKPSIKIIFALILISAIALPVGISKMPKDRTINSAIEGNEYLLQQTEQNIEVLKDDKTFNGKIEYEYALLDKDIKQLFVDYKVGIDDWRKDAIENYTDATYELAGLDFVFKGYGQDQIMDKLQGTDPKKVESYYSMTLAKRQELRAQLQLRKETLRKIIETDDYKAHINEEISEAQGHILSYENTISEYEKLKAKNPKTKEGKEKLQQLEKEAKDCKRLIENKKQDIKVLQFRLENEINYDLGNWKNNSIRTVEEELKNVRAVLMTEKEYSLMSAQEGYSMSYDEYVDNFNKTKSETINNIKTLWYGLENNIPSLNDITDARSTVDKTYEIYIILAVVMVIIIGGGIVATEFSKGTIRLLLIRPVSRWKVLLSKLLSLLIVGLGVVALGIGILYVSSGVVFGFETYNTPILQMINGSIVQESYINILLPKIMLSCSSLVFITSLVFAISTLAKNTALAVAISMLLYLGAGPLTDVIIGMKQSWIVNTLIPYINASYLRLVPMAGQALKTGFGMEFQYASGATQLLIASAVILVITFVTFTKKDINN